MIELNQRDQSITCSHCGEEEGLDVKEMRTPAVLMLRTGAMAAEHKACEQWSDNPARAKAERTYTVRMRALWPENLPL